MAIGAGAALADDEAGGVVQQMHSSASATALLGYDEHVAPGETIPILLRGGAFDSVFVSRLDGSEVEVEQELFFASPLAQPVEGGSIFQIEPFAYCAGAVRCALRVEVFLVVESSLVVESGLAANAGPASEGYFTSTLTQIYLEATSDGWMRMTDWTTYVCADPAVTCGVGPEGEHFIDLPMTDTSADWEIDL